MKNTDIKPMLGESIIVFLSDAGQNSGSKVAPGTIVQPWSGGTINARAQLNNSLADAFMTSMRHAETPQEALKGYVWAYPEEIEQWRRENDKCPELSDPSFSENFKKAYQVEEAPAAEAVAATAANETAEETATESSKGEQDFNPDAN